MGRPRSPYGYSLSRLNATKHGVLTRGVMRSRGLDLCQFRQVCEAARHADLRSSCIAGRECPVERAIHDAYLLDARRTFSFCKAWLSPEEFDKTIAELAVLELQKQRLSALVSRDGHTRPKRHPVSGREYGVEPSLAAGRYSTALDNRFRRLTDRLFDALPTNEQDASGNQAESHLHT